MQMTMVEGLQKIINIKAAMNKGLSNDLKSNFLNINIVDRPVNLTKNIVDNNWIAAAVREILMLIFIIQNHIKQVIKYN